MQVTSALNIRRDELYDRGINIEKPDDVPTCTADRVTTSESEIIDRLKRKIYDAEGHIFANTVPCENPKEAPTIKLQHARERKLFLFFEAARMIYDLQNHLGSGDY